MWYNPLSSNASSNPNKYISIYLHFCASVSPTHLSTPPKWQRKTFFFFAYQFFSHIAFHLHRYLLPSFPHFFHFPLCALSRSAGLTPPFQFGFPAALLSGEVIGTSAIGVIEGARVVCVCVCKSVLMFRVLVKHGAKGPHEKGGQTYRTAFQLE